MTKIVLLGDIHIGARNDNLIIAEHHISFFEKLLFPYLLKEKITRIIQFGDVFDRRKFVNFQILDMWKSRVFDWLLLNGIDVDVIAGNHDVYYKNLNDINSPMLLLREYFNIRPFIQATEREIDGNQVLYIPWINSSNEEQTKQAIKSSKASIAMGHLELNGFQMDRGYICDGGLDAKLFKRFHTVYSGHFHHKSDNGHIFYLGTPYQMTWVDFGGQKGFHVWDTKTLDLVRVVNPEELFIRYEWNDTGLDNYSGMFNYKGIIDKYIRVVVVNKKNLFEFDKFMSLIYQKNPADVKIIENMSDSDGEFKEEINLEDTSVVLDSYIDSIESAWIDKARLKNLMKQLHVEAQNMEMV